MSSAGRTHRRRATILVMVVAVLALLFVIVSGYLALARFDRQAFDLGRQGELSGRIIDGVNGLVLSLMRQQWADGDGELLSGKDPAQGAYEDIPGYRAAFWQAAAEPLFDPLAPAPAGPGDYDRRLGQVRWPALSWLDAGSGPQQRAVRELMFKQMADAGDSLFTLEDVRRNARLGFMDADGDGVPDADLLGSALATELANTLAGTPVRLRGTGIADASHIPPDGSPGTVDDLWRRYDELARYEVAVRVVPHGGMVSLAVAGATAGEQWNEEFAWQMFRWLARGKQRVDSRDQQAEALLEKLYAQAPAVEPLLRRRGGWLASYRDADDQGQVPEALRVLEGDYPRIFARPVNGEVPWQRFNLATMELGGRRDEWNRWIKRCMLDPLAGRSGDLGALGDYDVRHLVTTTSYSDEVARKLDERDPQDIWALGTYQGQSKFYLGQVEQCFDVNGRFRVESPRTYAIIERLADVFYDLLAGHDFADQPYNRRDQAYMLAVNTVAFAAPRVPEGPQAGFIDVVAHTSGGPLGRTYVGYAPQPFVTQVLVYDDDTSDSEDLAVAVELYNPNDRAEAGGADAQALYLGQFGISLNDLEIRRLDTSVLELARLEGRRFMSFVIHDQGAAGNTFFEDNRGAFARFNGLIADYPTESLDIGSGLTVKLWRRDWTGANWYLVDAAEVDLSQPAKDEDWFVDTWRDTRAESFWGLDSAGRAARWRMLLGPPLSSAEHDTFYHDLARDSQSPAGRLAELGTYGPEDEGFLPRFGPTVPLYCMNAYTAEVASGLGLPRRTTVHGAERPNSFPTVGFMLFVPRFSHLRSGANSTPVTEVMARAWEKQAQQENFDQDDYPADFGHLPIFDNRQDAKAGGYFTSGHAGRIPWGLLVFDYFTTLDPAGADGMPGTADDIDPYQVPGRININAAPWFVLAGLPVIGPGADADGDGVGDLPLHPSASPALWRSSSGILAGFGFDDVGQDMPRSLLYRSQSYPRRWLEYDGWWRLGVDLALAAAEYRDRLAHIDPQDPDIEYAYRGAYERNGSFWLYREKRYGDIRRGQDTPSDPKKYGLLSVGELANVKGFDSAVYAEDVGNAPLLSPLGAPGVVNDGGDFVRAVSLLALLDSHFLTTRSNTFTVYVTVRDRVAPQRSVRSQITVDRSNLLPRLVLDRDDSDGDGDRDEPLLVGGQPVVILPAGQPRLVAERRSGYYNARFDD